MGSSQAAVSFKNIARAIFGLGAAAFALNSSICTVHSGHRAVIFDRFRGFLDETVGEGTHFFIPWVQKPYIFDIRVRPFTLSSVSKTKDSQMVGITLHVISRPDTSRLPVIARNHGLQYKEKVLPSIGNEVLKGVVAQFNADQLAEEYPRVSDLVCESFTRRAKDFNVVLNHVAIDDVSYGAEFSRAMKQKQMAQIEAEISKYEAMKEEYERIEASIRAELRRIEERRAKSPNVTSPPSEDLACGS